MTNNDATTAQAIVNLSPAAADMLLECQVYGPLGPALVGLADREAARELEAEGFGRVHQDCETHGIWACPGAYACSADVTPVFIIGDAGINWLVDNGHLED